MGPMDGEPAFWNGVQWVQRRVAPATSLMGPMDHEPAFWNGRVQRRVAPATDSNITVSRKLLVNNSLITYDTMIGSISHLPRQLHHGRAVWDGRRSAG
jgi:hypothetical protein